MRTQKRERSSARPKQRTINDVAAEYGLLLMGSLIIAMSFNMFLSPNEVASGGVSGISIIVRSLWKIEPAITQWALNIPLFVAGSWFLGRQFGMKTAVGSLLLPLLILITRGLPPMTNNLLLASIYGGMLLGIGLGLVFRGKGSTGGSDVAAQIVHKYTGLSLGLSIAMLDAFVIVTAGIVLSPEKALYALIGLFVTSKTIGIVQIGLSYSKVAFIISEKSESIRQEILVQLDRGLTQLQATGGYTGEHRNVMMVVVGQREVNRLKELVRAADPEAFVILSDTNEVLGEGFKFHGSQN
jgi:uncharacterized membrane-anchored protein YitT (DUF2179 family)